MSEVLDRSRLQRLEEIKEELDRVDRKAARVMYEWGVLFAEVERDELWRDAGWTSFSAWVERDTPYSWPTARQAIAVYTQFTLDMVDRWGSTKLGAILTYAELTEKEEQPGDLVAANIKYRDTNGAYTSVGFVRRQRSRSSWLVRSSGRRTARARPRRS